MNEVKRYTIEEHGHKAIRVWSGVENGRYVETVEPISSVDEYVLATEQQEDKTETCEWETDADDDEWNMYQTACGNGFEFTRDGPIENAFKHCPYCGKPVEVVSETVEESTTNE